MSDVIRPQPATAYEVAEKSFAWVFEDPETRMQRGAAFMETLAHLKLLVARGEAFEETRDNVVYFGLQS